MPPPGLLEPPELLMATLFKLTVVPDAMYMPEPVPVDAPPLIVILLIVTIPPVILKTP